MIENAWWITEYGDPCRECGFDWSIEPNEAILLVEALPDRFAAVLDSSTGDEVFPGTTWSAKGYVFHVADNLRIFAERLEGVAAGGSTALPSYDQEELAAARRYEEMSLQSALWSLRDAVASWARANRASLTRGATFLHEERGPLSAAEIARGPAHDAVHHLWDVERATGGARPPAG